MVKAGHYDLTSAIKRFFVTLLNSYDFDLSPS